MQKVIVREFGRDSQPKTVCASDDASPADILRACGIDPQIKIIYLNGKIISNNKALEPIKQKGTVFLSVANKLQIR